MIDGKHLMKPPKDWQPLAREAGPATAYIEVTPVPRSAERRGPFVPPSRAETSLSASPQE